MIVCNDVAPLYCHVFSIRLRINHGPFCPHSICRLRLGKFQMGLCLLLGIVTFIIHYHANIVFTIFQANSVTENRTSLFSLTSYLSCLTDIDECATQTDDCSPNADCTNADGTFQCTCNVGFTGDGKTCDGRFKCPMSSIKEKLNGCREKSR